MFELEKAMTIGRAPIGIPEGHGAAVPPPRALLGRSMRHLLLAAALVGASFGGPASANSEVNVSSLTADGMTVHDLNCTLSRGGGLFAGIAIVGAIASKKDALHACAPEGGAARVSVVWGDDDRTRILKTSPGVQADCVRKAVRATAAPAQGRCEFTALLGPDEQAKAAAGELEATGEVDKPPPSKKDVDVSNLENWQVLTSHEKGVQFRALKGAETTIHTLSLFEQEWRLIQSLHPLQATFILHNDAGREADAKVADALFEEITPRAVELSWSTVGQGRIEVFSKDYRIEQTQGQKLTFTRIIANGDIGHFVILTATEPEMKPEQIQEWYRSLRFLETPSSKE
ncbi:MAG: hypothetical protein EA397_08520 [Deltaproteobacteria bacterium]|nr:MAG: hypothetical protein EA397_08520 [Deltaproteobacteria bacterium]